VALPRRRGAERHPGGTGSVAHRAQRLQSADVPRRDRGPRRTPSAAGDPRRRAPPRLRP
jgi:hypothetical protein